MTPMVTAVAKVDRNQGDIVKALRKAGATVQTLHTVGHGCPDILVGFRGRNYLMEIKSDEKAPLTEDEATWHETWRGEVFKVWDPIQAVNIITEDWSD